MTLTAGRPLYSELMNTTLHAPHHHSALHLRRHLSRRPRQRAHSPSSQVPTLLGSLLAHLPSVMRRPVWSFPSLLMSLSPLPPFVFASFSRFHRFRGRRRPGRGLLGRMRRHWILSPRHPGGSGWLTLVDESRPHPRSLYRPRLASPLRRLLVELGEAWPPRRKSRWSSCRRDGSTPGELVCPDPTRRGRDSPTLTPSDS